MRFVLALSIAAALAVVLAAQTPQTPAPASQQKPTFKTGVNFVRVDVYPSANGRIVSDLKQADFDVLEDNVPQSIETFEQIVARAPGIEAERGDPRSQAESDEAAADPRNRLFVLFFDTLHTAGYQGGSASFGTYDPKAVGRALVTFLDELIGPDDLVGVMRPEMPVETLTFTRRPSSFMDFLLSGADWQKRFLDGELDDTERKYEACYPPGSPEADMAPKMIARRRELLMLDGLHSLVTHLQNLREGRKAVIVVSEGWRLYTPDESMARPRRGEVPGPPPITIGSTGQPTLGSDPRNGNVMVSECERDRLMLARIDNERNFRQMLDDANRANVSFYPVDPRGLTPESNMTRRSDSLATLATATDGIPVTQSNDFAPGLKRIRDDLSSYYLLGYTSTNSKFDGRFRTITVRVKRPGVTVRARRGYLAPTEAELTSRARAEAPRDPEAELRDTALSRLGTERPDRPLHVTAGYLFEGTGEGQARRPLLWITGELDLAAARLMEWSAGGEATIIVSSVAGQTVATEHATITATVPRFAVPALDARLTPGDYLVKVRLQGKAGAAADASDQVRITLPDLSGPAAPVLGQPLLFRRGPFTGAGFQATSDLRFRKAERIRVDVPLAAATNAPSARLLDRRGQPMPLPVTVGQREDAARRFTTAELALAPLAPGDYLIEVAVRRGEKTEKVLTAFRIVP
jgi:VWFA-related protein